jgi:MFS family permease
MTEVSISSGNLAARQASPDPRRWLLPVVIGIAQLMVMLDATIVNIALPSAQKSLGFSSVDRQWVVTAYALAFGSLLVFGGRLPGRVRRVPRPGGAVAAEHHAQRPEETGARRSVSTGPSPAAAGRSAWWSAAC